MAPYLHCALFALVTALASAAPPQQLAPDQVGVLEKARAAAMRYAASLPDFICTEIVRRSEDPQGNSRWRALDLLTVKLSYFGHHEDYKLMLIDQKPTLLEYMNVGGVLSTGEFGTSLYSVFDPRSRGDFHWKGWTTVRKRRAARFTFHIARENSIYRIQYGTVPVGPNSIVVGYRGEVLVDEETQMVLRLIQQAEIPQTFPITANGFTVDYEFTTVGGRPYLLPARAHVVTRSGRSVLENNVEFRDYRKFQTETNITFQPPTEPSTEKK
jgi:hypothetical protein